MGMAQPMMIGCHKVWILYILCNKYNMNGFCIFMQVGIIHNINKLHDDLPNVNLAISLHAPVQDIRCRIMPAARAFPLERLIDALQFYQTKR